MTIGDYLCTLLGAYGIFVMLRNPLVFRWRTKLLDGTLEGTRLYLRLPSYREMLHHPRYWGMWTCAAWRKYAMQRLANELPLPVHRDEHGRKPIDHDMFGNPIYEPLGYDQVTPVTDPAEIERVRKRVAALIDQVMRGNQ
jgi:hypothetical protein